MIVDVCLLLSVGTVLVEVNWSILHAQRENPPFDALKPSTTCFILLPIVH